MLFVLSSYVLFTNLNNQLCFKNKFRLVIQKLQNQYNPVVVVVVFCCCCCFFFGTLRTFDKFRCVRVRTDRTRYLLATRKNEVETMVLLVTVYNFSRRLTIRNGYRVLSVLLY